MKREIFLSLLVLLLLSGCTPTNDSDSDVKSDSDTSSYERDNDDDSDDDDDDDDHDDDTTNISPTQTITTHNQGIDCLSCHAYPARDADGEDFYSGVTIFTQLDATQPQEYAYGYTIRVTLSNGQTFDYETKEKRGTGNAYSEDARLLSYDFTAHVLDPSGTIVNSSMINSHTPSRLACNTCHTASGNNGAPGRVASQSIVSPVSNSDTTDVNVTTDSLTFVDDVLPILTNNCQVCHNSNVTTYSSLISFGGINMTYPDSSLLLQKASGSVSHVAGTILTTTSSEYMMLREWIVQGLIEGTTQGDTAPPIETNTPTTSTPTFATNVLPILTTNCQVCHGSDVTNHTNVMRFGAIDTVNPTSSLLLQKASGSVPHTAGTIFSSASIQYTTIRDWISAGAQNN
ncbi:MAG: hypothetical protein J7J31_11140 [Helicobacteraceae bacterium]|nr:hypothetical protein [Helicobacteraceae bacterium]